MIRTGIFGGSFNPIHCGHIALARQLLQRAGLDEIWFVVSPQNPFKQDSELADERLRFSMVKLALAGEPHMAASDFEFSLPRPSYMWNTLRAMTRQYPDRRFTLLVGGDNWAAFGRWHRHADILANYRVVVYPRRGAAGQGAAETEITLTAGAPGVMVVDTGLIDISSTEVRRRIAAGLPVSGMVPPAVERTISSLGLYAGH